MGHLLNTLDSYIYSIKGNGISYMYNDNIENQVSKNVYPNDSVASFDEIVIFEDKEKWTYYESDDFTFNPNENVKVYLKQLDNDKKELSKNDYSLSKTIFRIHGYEKENG